MIVKVREGETNLLLALLWLSPFRQTSEDLSLQNSNQCFHLLSLFFKLMMTLIFQVLPLRLVGLAI